MCVCVCARACVCVCVCVCVCEREREKMDKKVMEVSNLRQLYRETLGYQLNRMKKKEILFRRETKSRKENP